MKKQMILKRIAPILLVFCIFATVLPATTAMAASKITLKKRCGGAVHSLCRA